jgi:hypothetical protein
MTYFIYSVGNYNLTFFNSSALEFKKAVIAAKIGLFNANSTRAVAKKSFPLQSQATRRRDGKSFAV